MLHLRRAAFQLLRSSPTQSFLPKSRSISTLNPSVLQSSRVGTTGWLQRRWDSTSAPVDSSKESAADTADAPEEGQSEMDADGASSEGSSEASGSSMSGSSYAGDAIRTAKEKAARMTERIGEAGSSAGVGIGDREPKSTIYIGNLFFDVTPADLEKELSRFGTVTQARVIRDSRGLSKGFGYVDFETTAAATKAIETLDQQLFEGRRLSVQYATYSSRQLEKGQTPGASRLAKPRNPPSRTIFIGNMSFEMTDRDLNHLFRSVKNVVDIRVAIDRRTGQPRGFAHADFLDVQSAVEAVKFLETQESYGRKLRLDFSYGPTNAPRNLPDANRQKGVRSEDAPHESPSY